MYQLLKVFKNFPNVCVSDQPKKVKTKTPVKEPEKSTEKPSTDAKPMQSPKKNVTKEPKESPKKKVETPNETTPTVKVIPVESQDSSNMFLPNSFCKIL